MYNLCFPAKSIISYPHNFPFFSPLPFPSYLSQFNALQVLRKTIVGACNEQLPSAIVTDADVLYLSVTPFTATTTATATAIRDRDKDRESDSDRDSDHKRRLQVQQDKLGLSLSYTVTARGQGLSYRAMSAGLVQSALDNSFNSALHSLASTTQAKGLQGQGVYTGPLTTRDISSSSEGGGSGGGEGGGGGGIMKAATLTTLQVEQTLDPFVPPC